MALKEVTIHPVIRSTSGDTVLFNFVLTADQLLAIGEVLRFGQHPEGVNRMFVNNHALGIAKYMREAPDPVFAENMVGNLRDGEDSCAWVYDEKTLALRAMVETDEEERLSGACLVISDGQHRFAALQMLSAEDRKRFEFPFTATLNAPHDLQLSLFRKQTLQRRQNRRLQLKIDCFRGVLPRNDRVAYAMALRLNSDPSSPLQGKVYFDENPRVPKDQFNLLSLFGDLKATAGKSSFLHGTLDEREQEEAVFNMFRAAAMQWAHRWGRTSKILGKPLGLRTLIRLLSHGGRFHQILNGDFSLESFERAFEFGKGFKWEVKTMEPGQFNPNSMAALPSSAFIPGTRCRGSKP